MADVDLVTDFIAKGMPTPTHLQCMTCGKRRPMEGHATEVGQFLATGWPKCCGYTMRLFTVRDRAFPPLASP